MSDSTDRQMAIADVNMFTDRLDTHLGMMALTRLVGAEAGIAPENSEAAEGLTRRLLASLSAYYKTEEGRRVLVRQWEKETFEMGDDRRPMEQFVLDDLIARARAARAEHIESSGVPSATHEEKLDAGHGSGHRRLAKKSADTAVKFEL